MSCGSTACTTEYDLPASKPFAGFERLWQGPSAWLDKISRGCERRHQRRQLLELNDRLLADIGLSREQAVEEACKSFWTGETMWRVYL
jgi:uncharacterized protein YjiS (DUF1127 family)